LSNSVIAEQLKQLPARPGVYLFKDAAGNILYVGKAASLRHRVKSYFGGGGRLNDKLKRLVVRVSELDFYVTGSEQEALILECNLIKKHRPCYNVSLKDDKTFPYLRISLDEDWPRVYVTRRLGEGGGRYFGPFASAGSVRRTLKVIQGIFPFRGCRRTITGSDLRPCLDYYIHRCAGPCVGAVSRQEYRQIIKQVVLFLEGRRGEVVKQLEDKMSHAAESQDYERAALYRDQIEAIHRVIEGQRIATAVKGEQDVIAFASDGDRAYAQVFFIRGGKLIGRESFVLRGARFEEPTGIMTGFVEQFYSSSAYVPPLVLLQHPVEDDAVIEGWLGGRRGSRVRLQVPRRGDRERLVDIVAENARQGLEQLKIKQLAAPSALAAALDEIKRELRLPDTPSRIEGYDISNIQGLAAVGSMVVFEEGKPSPSHYRRFKIKTVSGADDYAMLGEVLLRRFKRGRNGSASGGWAAPDLILIDGGKGQLNAALKAMADCGVDSIPAIGLAKENEEIFLPRRAKPVVLPPTSPGLQLLQRVRDEAHRFAIGYYRQVHRRQTFASVLDSIPGIGPGCKRALLRQFGSVKGIREASEKELAAVKGMSAGSARKMKEGLG